LFTANFKFTFSFIVKRAAVLLIWALLFSFSSVQADLKGVKNENDPDPTEQKLKPVPQSSAKGAPVINKMPTKSEKEWLAEVGESIEVGKKVMITLYSSDGTERNEKYLAFYAERNLLTERGTIVILHDRESHPDWKSVVRPLRTELPDTGWNTLSLQLPILEKDVNSFEELDKFYKQSYERINGAILFLNEQKAKNVMVVAYGTSTMTALSYISNQARMSSLRLPVAAISALVLISPYSVKEEKYIEQELTPLSLIRIPVLDLYGGDDLDIVKKYAKKRAGLAKRSGNAKYLQQKIENADHFYMAQSDTVVKRVHSFFMGVIEPVFEIQRPLGQYLTEIK